MGPVEGRGGDHVTIRELGPVTITLTRLGGPGTEGRRRRRRMNVELRTILDNTHKSRIPLYKKKIRTLDYTIIYNTSVKNTTQENTQKKHTQKKVHKKNARKNTHTLKSSYHHLPSSRRQDHEEDSTPLH